MMWTETCFCGHSAQSHIYPGSTLFGDCHECRCELYNPPGGLRGVPVHPLFAFTEDEYRMVSCTHCAKFRVSPDGICESCDWDNDRHGDVGNTRPDYCGKSPTKKHEVPLIAPALSANYCRFCLKTILLGQANKNERIARFWKPSKGV